MACETPGSDPHILVTRTWERLFAEDKGHREDTPFVDVKRGVNADFDGLNVFLQDSEDAVPSRAVEDISTFCEGVTLEDLRSGSGHAGKRRAAWVDDRRRPSRHVGHCSPRRQMSDLVQEACSIFLPSRVLILYSIPSSQERPFTLIKNIMLNITISRGIPIIAIFHCQKRMKRNGAIRIR
jgi:hypothetical protein